jgi:hypothetical protein
VRYDIFYHVVLPGKSCTRRARLMSYICMWRQDLAQKKNTAAAMACDSTHSLSKSPFSVLERSIIFEYKHRHTHIYCSACEKNMPFPLAHHPLQKKENHLPLLLLQSHRGDFLNLILKMRGPRRSLTSSTWTATKFAAREWQIMLTNQS